MPHASSPLGAKALSNASSSGFSLIEGVLAGTILLLLAVAAAGALTQGRENSNLSARHSQAILLAEEGLEAVRNIRDENFSLLTAGTHGLTRNSGTWAFGGLSDVTGEFSRNITITDINANKKNVKAVITWQQNAQRTGAVSLETLLTNWKAPAAPVTSCSLQCQTLGYSTGTCRQNVSQCTNNGETHESLGDAFCTGGPSADTCCCKP